jgi:hypothetical protein
VRGPGRMLNQNVVQLFPRVSGIASVVLLYHHKFCSAGIAEEAGGVKRGGCVVVKEDGIRRC